ncbi:hypothetical protein HY251_16500 [bacterium]|nr:hypothetical protein [bacterium]
MDAKGPEPPEVPFEGTAWSVWSFVQIGLVALAIVAALIGIVVYGLSEGSVVHDMNYQGFDNK